MNNKLSAAQLLRMSILAVVLGVALSTPASAQTTIAPESITPEMREAFDEARPYCEEDAAKFCRWTVPGGGRVVKCMVEHIEELSPTCQQKIVEMIPQ
jgi:hypothetical protein